MKNVDLRIGLLGSKTLLASKTLLYFLRNPRLITIVLKFNPERRVEKTVFVIGNWISILLETL